MEILIGMFSISFGRKVGFMFMGKVKQGTLQMAQKPLYEVKLLLFLRISCYKKLKFLDLGIYLGT